MPTSPLVRLGAFRDQLHACFPRRADALLDLGDALLCAETVPSLPHLSLEPAHRRGWGSTYAALASGRVQVERLRDLLAGCLPDADPLVFAVDVTTWPRCDAECSPERGYYYHPSRHSAGQPIIAGWAYQWIAQLSFDRDSWTAPVDARRLHPLDDTDQTAASQIRALLGRLPAGGSVPLFVFDGGYDSAQLTLDLADAGVAVLVRLRSDRCFYADPPPAAHSRKGGRPRRHGAKFNCADPTTWPVPTATLGCQDDQYGTVTVHAWRGLHPKQQRHPGHGTRRPRPIVRGTILRVQVERVPAKTRPPKVLWLWWAGPGPLDLDQAWRAYTRRFDLEHTVRFCKQTLGWTIPRPRHPEQADRWTWLVLAGYTQLRLARDAVADRRLPWERPRPQPRLSAYRDAGGHRTGSTTRPVIEVLYVEGCPNYRGTLGLVERVRAELGIDTELRTTLISDQAAADRARFPGSPTVRVDDRDVEPGSEPPAEYTLACRLYRLEHRFAGQPEERWVREALLRAAGRT